MLSLFVFVYIFVLFCFFLWQILVVKTGHRKFWVNEERICIIFPAKWKIQTFSAFENKP